ncbi:hypothetical protein ES703_89146 [subsurface metagenome]
MVILWLTSFALPTDAVTPSDTVMPWFTERLKAASAEVVAVMLSGWLISLPLPTAAVTPSAMVIVWLTSFALPTTAVTPSDTVMPWLTERLKAA